MRALAHEFGYLVFAGTHLRVDMMRAIGGAHEVNMRIDKAWQNGLATQVNHFALHISQATYLVIAAHSENAPTGQVNRHSLRARLRRIHRIYVSIEINNSRHNQTYLFYQCIFARGSAMNTANAMLIALPLAKNKLLSHKVNDRL
ncbi:hypothetical protein KSB_20740 [Ktedonobacter robiniae]|uniref:Uncharacterized protein n=1 Tax=Ktedonobacter robiniae TaxID=2778365 RepID=A0ABQ3ULI4_9CHLR|nr:hypothetical protein KSB_20740 [Ktedonobacter robiniae]